MIPKRSLEIGVRKLLMLLLILVGSGCSHQPSPARVDAARELILSAAMQGDYTQMCAAWPEPGKFQLDGMTFDFHFVDEEHFEEIRRDREAALAALRDLIPVYLRFGVEGEHGDIEHTTRFLLNVAVDLNAVELLPVLLGVEKEYRPRYVAAQTDERGLAWEVRIRYTQIMTTIATLLRAEEWPELMKTELGNTPRPGTSDTFKVVNWELEPAWRDLILRWANENVEKYPNADGRPNMSPKSVLR